MAEIKKMATREGYGRGLVALGAEHEDIVVLDADLARKPACLPKRTPTVISTAASPRRI